jgi:orotidine-5'-phosphate decarboxylase
MRPSDRIILAVDTPDADQAERWVEQLRGRIGGFKIGLELVNAVGWEIFDRLKSLGADRIFYDAKFHDIPNTVAGAVRAASQHGLWMVNVHAQGGSRMISAARRELDQLCADTGQRPMLLAVTLLTSLDQNDLKNELLVDLAPREYVTWLARMAQSAGADGVVASPHEIEAVRAACGPDFKIVTPGVRPAGAEAGDQKRVMTPGSAVALGADYLVVGRALTGAQDVQQAACLIAEEIAAATLPGQN